MKNSLIAILILFSTFAFGQNDSAETPKIAIKIPLGKTISVKNVSIKFLEVMEDSRCPTGVSCIWAGRAIVKVEVTKEGKKEERILTFGATKPNEEKNTNLYSSEDFAINGIKLAPYPSAKDAGKNKEYVLFIYEEKNN